MMASPPPAGSPVLASLRRLRAMITKEFLHILRDRASLMMCVCIPAFMLILFGYAVDTDVDHLPTVVWDQSRSQESRALLDGFANTTYFNISRHVGGYADVRDALERGTARVAIIIPPDYDKDIGRGIPTNVQVLVDGTDPQVARNAVNSAELLLRGRAVDIINERFRRQGISLASDLPVEARPRVWYNPEMKSRVFNIPGLIGLLMQNVTVTLTAFSLVRERESGTMEQLIVTPIRRFELLFGKMIPYVLVGMISFGFCLLVGIEWFDVHVRGSLTLLIVLGLLFLTTSLSVGLLVSTISHTQMEAMQMTTFFILPSFLLSGFLFPRETMPVLVQWIGNAVPLTYFVVILRGVFLKEATLEQLLPETGALLVFATVLITVAVLRFHKRLD